MVIRSDWPLDRVAIRSDGHPIGWPFDSIVTSFGKDVFVYDGWPFEVRCSILKTEKYLYPSGQSIERRLDRVTIRLGQLV